MKKAPRRALTDAVNRAIAEGSPVFVEKAPCHCLILHARTEAERKRVGQALESARSLGDTTGITILLAQLGPCKSDPVEDPDAHRERVRRFHTGVPRHVVKEVMKRDARTIVPPDRIVALMKERAAHIACCTATEIERALIEAWVEGANGGPT